jgi:hypothetical protein
MIEDCRLQIKSLSNAEEIHKNLVRLQRYQMLKKELAKNLGTVVVK